MKPILLAIVEDDTATRSRLTHAIRQDASLDLLHAAGTVAEILSWLRENPVDVLLVDLGLPDGSGIDVIGECRRLQPACEVMVLTMFADEANMIRAFEGGARGYLLKDGTEQDLAVQVKELHAGGSPMSPIIARRLLTRWSAGRGTGGALSPRNPPPEASRSLRAQMSAAGLTGKERQVLDLVARGFTYVEVAVHMKVSVSTVQTHVRGIYAKLEVHNKAEAIFEARQLGLLP